MKKITFVTLLIFISFTSIIKANDFDPDSLISDINYDYEITSGYYNDEYWTLCLGTLSLTIEVPDTVDRIIFQRANGPTVKFKYPPFYNLHAHLDISGKSKVSVKREQVRHDSYFRVLFYTKEGCYPSSHYAVKDLISPEDLERLQETNSAIEINEDAPQIEVINGGISIKCKDKCYIEVVSIDGKSIYCGTLYQDTEIPLYSGMYIVRNHFNNKCESKKIIIK